MSDAVVHPSGAPEGADPLVAARDLTLAYPGALPWPASPPVLSGVSLEVPEGSVFALLGRNGTGKSTLVRALLGLLAPRSGSLEVLGLDPWRRRTEVLASVGVVPEEPEVAPAATVEAAIRFVSRLYPTWDDERVEAHLDRFDLPRRMPFGRLSKGQRTQVALALALGPRPRLLVLDDPTLGLDVAARRTVFDELIGELADRGTTVFLTSHDLGPMERVADRVGVLAGGRLVLEEDLESLRRRFRRVLLPASGAGSDPSRDELTRAEAALEALEPVASRRTAFGVEVTVARFAVDTWNRLELASDGRARLEAPGLEDIFTTLTEPTRSGSAGRTP